VSPSSQEVIVRGLAFKGLISRIISWPAARNRPPGAKHGAPG
jgi:hypothetical protein